jgi:hypothetical protein
MADPATACPAVDCKRAVNFPIATAFRDAHQMMAQLAGSPWLQLTANLFEFASASAGINPRV